MLMRNSDRGRRDSSRDIIVQFSSDTPPEVTASSLDTSPDSDLPHSLPFLRNTPFIYMKHPLDDIHSFVG